MPTNFVAIIIKWLYVYIPNFDLISPLPPSVGMRKGFLYPISKIFNIRTYLLNTNDINYVFKIQYKKKMVSRHKKKVNIVKEYYIQNK